MQPAERDPHAYPHDTDKHPVAESLVDRDDRLAAAVRLGDEAACEQLYIAYHDALWRFAWRYVKSRDVAEELVQEVFLDLWRNRATWTVRETVRAWLYRAVRNRALNHVRYERVRGHLADHDIPPLTPALPDAPDDEPTAQAVLEQAELEAAAVRAVDALPERRRVAVTLRWRHELSTAEIAQVLGTTPESVRVLLTRARHDLAELLGLLRSDE